MKSISHKMALSQKKHDSNEINEDDRQLRLQHRYLLLRKLGQGTYGKVQLALNKETNKEVAVKTIKKAKIENKEDMLRIRREIHIMTSIRHPHIIHINEVFETKQKIVIVMHYASGGELYDYLGCHQILPEYEARRIFRQIASAIYYCHKNQICHRDLKLENILLDEEGNAQIADFGLSNIFDDKRRMNTFCGSPLYASPEIVKGTPYKGPEVDCWSLGVLLYTLVYGTMPFDGRNFKELVSQISEGKYEEPLNRSNASGLIKRLLTPDVSKRATITDVCKDGWINQGYNASLFELAENMALAAGLPQKEKNTTTFCPETNAKSGRGSSRFKKDMKVEGKDEKIAFTFSNTLENGVKANDMNFQTRKSNLYEQMMSYDVRFVLNKIIIAVDASLSTDKNNRNYTNSKMHIRNIQKKDVNISEKVDSAYVIPIFEVTSNIPNKCGEKVRDKTRKDDAQNKIINRILSKPAVSQSENETCIKMSCKPLIPDYIVNTHPSFTNRNSSNCQSSNITNENLSVTNGCARNQILLTESQKQFYSLDISEQPDYFKVDRQLKKQESDPFASSQPSLKTKWANDDFSFRPKIQNPFMRTKHHVLNLARILSLNYEKLKRSSFRMPTCKKKPPGKITIPPTFDPNNPPAAVKKPQEEKKELLIFPTVSVSENKQKIQKKIEKIKKAALNKNIIIRSNSKTRMRIEKYIRTQVKRIQDLVCEEQRSMRESLENFDEQSIRDMSEIYYRAFGSENTDSGIANAEEEEYFCFLCSKPNGAKATANLIDSIVLDSMKKGCLYTSNHLHVPMGKEQKKWNYTLSNNNNEFGTLNKCKSEIKIPMEYLNYISSNNSELNKNTHYKQQFQKKNIGNTKCFTAVSSILQPVNSNFRILHSASDSVGLHLSNDAFEVLKLNTDGQDDIYSNSNIIPCSLDQILLSSKCNISQMNHYYGTQSSAVDTENTKSINTSFKSDKDDGIGDSNDSFQSCIKAFENIHESKSELSRSKSSHSYMDFIVEKNNHKIPFSKRLPSEPYLLYNNNVKNPEIANYKNGANSTDISTAGTWMLENDENILDEQKSKNKGLRRRNTMACVRDEGGKIEQLKLDKTATEFENYLWNVYKGHLLESTQNDTVYMSSPNLHYYSFDRKAKLKNRDYIKREFGNDFTSNTFLNFLQNSEQNPNETLSSNMRNFLECTSINHSREYTKSLNRTKSISGDIPFDSDRDDIIRKLKTERKFSQGSISYETNIARPPFVSHFLNNLEKKEHGRKTSCESNRRHILKNILPHNKRTKLEYKKSFLQLLALKRIQEAEKELDKAPEKDLTDVEENSSSLLEALKTHGYKSVISQRFQEPNDDYLDPLDMKYLKSPRNLRAELARLNYTYYESLPKFTLDSYEANDYYNIYNDLDYNTNMLNGYAIPSYPTKNKFRQKVQKQFVYDWLNTTQTDDYLNCFRSNTLYVPEETPSSELQNCCVQWGKENNLPFDDETTTEVQKIVENNFNSTKNHCSPKHKEKGSKEPINLATSENSQIYCTDDEVNESVHDRIWRKSFYSRFNNRALSRKEKSHSTVLEPEFLPESRLGLLNELYNPTKLGFDRSDFPQWERSNKSFKMKKMKKHSTSLDKYESRSSMKKKYYIPTKEKQVFIDSKTSYLIDENIEMRLSNSSIEPEEIEPEH